MLVLYYLHTRTKIRYNISRHTTQHGLEKNTGKLSLLPMEHVQIPTTRQIQHYVMQMIEEGKEKTKKIEPYKEIFDDYRKHYWKGHRVLSKYYIPK